MLVITSAKIFCATHRNHHIRRFILYQTLTLAWPYIPHVFVQLNIEKSDIILCACEFLFMVVQFDFRCILETHRVHAAKPSIYWYIFIIILLDIKIKVRKTHLFTTISCYWVFFSASALLSPMWVCSEDVNRQPVKSDMPCNYQFAKQYLTLIKRLDNNRLRYFDLTYLLWRIRRFLR